MLSLENSRYEAVVDPARYIAAPLVELAAARAAESVLYGYWIEPLAVYVSVLFKSAHITVVAKRVVDVAFIVHVIVQVAPDERVMPVPAVIVVTVPEPPPPDIHVPGEEFKAKQSAVVVPITVRGAIGVIVLIPIFPVEGPVPSLSSGKFIP